MKKLNNRAMSLAIISIIILVIVGVIMVAVTLPIGLLVTQSMKTITGNFARNTTVAEGAATWYKTRNATYEGVFSNIWSGFSIVSISPIVLGAAGILSIMLVAFIGVIIGKRRA